MISGECRVDAIPPADGVLAGHRLSIDGLRLRLDLRIVPAADGAGGAAVLRVEQASVTTLPLFGVSVPAVYRRAAVLSSLAMLTLAVVVWFAGTPPEREELASPRDTSAVSARPAPVAKSSGRSASSGNGSSSAGRAEPTRVADGVPGGNTRSRASAAWPEASPSDPQQSVAPPVGASPASDARAATPHPAAAPGGAGPSTSGASHAVPGAGAAKSAAAAPVRTAPAAERVEAPAQPRATGSLAAPARASQRSDMLDLFADTK